MKNKKGSSLWMLTGAMLIFGTVGVFRKYIEVPSVTLACIRGLVGAVFLLLCALIGRKKLFRGLDGRRMALLLLSGAAIGVNWYLLFESFNYTSVSVGTLFYYTEPTLVILASVLFFGEKMTLKKGLCTAAALAGMVLLSGITDGGAASGGFRGILLAFGAALLYTCVVLLNKRITGVDPYGKTVLQMSAAAAVLIPLIAADALRTGVSPLPSGAREILLTAVMGILHTGIAYALYFASMEALEARTVALFSYIDPVTALFLSVVILGDRLTAAGVIGAVLIIGAALVSEFAPEFAFSLARNRKK